MYNNIQFQTYILSHRISVIDLREVKIQTTLIPILNNRYRIVKLFGQGGWGAIYRAWDMNLGSACVIKENLDTSPAAQRQFEREAQILYGLAHPNLPKVIDHFVIPGQGQYLVMEFVKGQLLEGLINSHRKPLPETQVLEWIGQVCDALTYLHSQVPPIIHRDIKPANIKITNQNKAMLVDFGMVKIFDQKLIKSAGAYAITPGYSPPEQYGKGVADARNDVYALGATCYTLLTGRIPPASIDIMTKRIASPPPVRNVNPKVAYEVSAAIEKAMQPDHSQRFPTISEFKANLIQPSRVVDQPKKLTSQPTQPPTKSLARPLNWRWIGAIGGFTLVVLILFFLLSSSGKFVSGSKDSPTSTAEFLVALSTVTQSSTKSTYFPTTTPTFPPTETRISHPTAETLELYLSQTPTLSPITILSHTSTPFPIMLIEWRPFQFIEVNAECTMPDASCWKGSCSFSINKTGGETRIDSAKLTGEKEILIDPGWDNPYLIFWNKYDFKNPGSIYTARKGGARIEVKVNNLFEYLKVYGVGNSRGTWIKESLDLRKYKGKNIQFIFSAQCPSEWYLQDIQIIPDFAPPP